LLSLALHLTLFLSLLIVPPTQPPTSASGLLRVDRIMGNAPGTGDVGAARPDGGNRRAD
jgi:hypothetical protein